MPHFLDAPSTASGTRVLVDASPAGLVVRTRGKDGSETSSQMPADVALLLLDEAEHLRMQIEPGTPVELPVTVVSPPVGWGTWTWFAVALATATAAFGTAWEFLR